MKKIIAMLLALMLCVSMIACSNTDKDTDKDNDEEETTVETTEATEADETEADETEADETEADETEAEVTEAPVVDEPEVIEITLFKDCEAALEGYFTAINTGDAELVYSVMFDPYMVEMLVDWGIVADESEMVALCEEMVAGYEGVKVTEFSTLDVIELDSDDLAELGATLAEDYGYPEDVLEAATAVAVGYTMEADGESEEIEEVLGFAKIDGNWYLSEAVTEMFAYTDEY